MRGHYSSQFGRACTCGEDHRWAVQGRVRIVRQQSRMALGEEGRRLPSLSPSFPSSLSFQYLSYPRQTLDVDAVLSNDANVMYPMSQPTATKQFQNGRVRSVSAAPFSQAF